MQNENLQRRGNFPVAGVKHVAPSGHPIVTGRAATCKAPGLCVAAGRWLVNVSPSRSLRLAGKTSRPGLALHGPLAGLNRECQSDEKNGSNDNKMTCK